MKDHPDQKYIYVFKYSAFGTCLRMRSVVVWWWWWYVTKLVVCDDLLIPLTEPQFKHYLLCCVAGCFPLDWTRTDFQDLLHCAIFSFPLHFNTSKPLLTIFPSFFLSSFFFFFFLIGKVFDVIVKMHQKSLFFCFLPLLPQRMVVCTHFHHFLYLSLLIEIVLMFGTGLLANGLSCSILQKLVLLRMHCIMGSRGLFYVQLHLMQLRSNDKYLATDEIIEVSVVPRHL